MENNGFDDSGLVKNPLARGLLSFSWISFLFISFGGLKSFAFRTGFDGVSDVAEIGWTSQIIIVGLGCLVILVTILYMYGDFGKVRRILPFPIFLVFVWCVLTLFGSSVPFIGLRRLILTMLVALSVFSVVQGLGPWSALRLFALCIAILTVVSVLACLTLPSAVHPPTEHNVNLIGAWRGIFFHKNHAGLAAALCVLFSFFFWRMKQGQVWLAVAIAGIILLVMSRSKTSLILCLPSLLSGVYLGKLKGARRDIRAIVTLFTAIGLITIITMTLIIAGDKISAILDDPTAFTGRMTLWKSLWSTIVENPFMGVGYGSIYKTGIRTVIYNPTVTWLSYSVHGHNGYLDVLASTGIIGCFLTVFAFLITPFLQITRWAHSSFQIMAELMYAILAFLIFHELLETSLLDRTRSAWIAFLFVYAVAEAILIYSKRGLHKNGKTP